MTLGLDFVTKSLTAELYRINRERHRYVNNESVDSCFVAFFLLSFETILAIYQTLHWALPLDDWTNVAKSTQSVFEPKKP